MKLILGIVRSIDAGPVVDQLITEGYRVTRVASTGGFLRRGNVTLLIGAEDESVDHVIDVMRKTCSEPEPGQHRATVFVVNAPYFEQI